jgi:hypothetical protein
MRQSGHGDLILARGLYTCGGHDHLYYLYKEKGTQNEDTNARPDKDTGFDAFK